MPNLSDQQWEAMALIDEINGSPEYQLHMDFQPGEIQLINNYAVMHSRTAYEDHPDPALKRDLIPALAHARPRISTFPRSSTSAASRPAPAPSPASRPGLRAVIPAKAGIHFRSGPVVDGGDAPGLAE